MEYNAKEVARKQYIKYFIAWFVIAAVLVAAWGVLFLVRGSRQEEIGRGNTSAPTERVFDMAGTLKEEEKDELRELIDQEQERGKCDIVLVIVNQEVGLEDSAWNRNMMNLADDFYDEGQFGYNHAYGDGALLLYNWYEDERGSQKGVWLSTTGKMEYRIGVSEEDDILDALDRYMLKAEPEPAKAYAAAIKRIGYWGERAERSGKLTIPWPVVILVPFGIAGIFCMIKLQQKPGEKTITATTYVAGGQPAFRIQRDDFVRKSVTKVKIQSSSGGHGGGSAGHHTSSGGHSHGGGGRRH